MYTHAMPRPYQGGPTKTRGVRVPNALWHAAQEKAATEGTTVTAVILAALTRYVSTPPKPPGPDERPPKS
jgi:hypothetical protein